MPSGWDVYYIIFLSAALALGIPAILALGSMLFSRKKKPGAFTRPLGGARIGAEEPGTETSILGQRINTRIFLGANAALLLIALVLMIVPCVVDIRQAEDKIVIGRALAAIVSVAVFAAMALLYAARKGDLSWLKSYRRGEKP